MAAEPTYIRHQKTNPYSLEEKMEENGQEKAPRHFLQSYSGVLILAVKAHGRYAVRARRAALTAAVSGTTPGNVRVPL
jgi:hypothetical protein